MTDPETEREAATLAMIEILEGLRILLRCKSAEAIPMNDAEIALKQSNACASASAMLQKLREARES